MPLVDIALFNVEEVQHRKKQSDDAPLVPPSLIGAARVFQELQYQFDVIDSTADFNKYKLIVLPDRLTFDNDTQSLATEIHEKLRNFVEQGGSIIASYKSGVVVGANNSSSDNKERFLWEDIYGVKVDSSLEVYSPDYIIGEGENFPAVEHGKCHNTKISYFPLDPVNFGGCELKLVPLNFLRKLRFSELNSRD